MTATIKPEEDSEYHSEKRDLESYAQPLDKIHVSVFFDEIKDEFFFQREQEFDNLPPN